jgi:hypothetical protein
MVKMGPMYLCALCLPITCTYPTKLIIWPRPTGSSTTAKEFVSLKTRLRKIMTQSPMSGTIMTAVLHYFGTNHFDTFVNRACSTNAEHMHTMQAAPLMKETLMAD